MRDRVRSAERASLGIRIGFTIFTIFTIFAAVPFTGARAAPPIEAKPGDELVRADETKVEAPPRVLEHVSVSICLCNPVHSPLSTVGRASDRGNRLGVASSIAGVIVIFR